MTEYLYLFQIGPVQSFIAAARRTQDLYVGSRILSLIAGEGVKAALASNAEMIFPAITGKNALPSSIPHRFAFISSSTPSLLGAEVESDMRKFWQASFAGIVKGWLINRMRDAGLDHHKGWQQCYSDQVEDWLEVYWVALPYDRKQHSAIYGQAAAAMAARKHLRAIQPVHEPGIKCSLTGMQSALPLNETRETFTHNRRDLVDTWDTLAASMKDNKRILIRQNETLGGLATLKRFAQLANGSPLMKDEKDRRTLERFPSTTHIAGGIRLDEEEQPPETIQDASGGRGYYLAILHMDGDRMGTHLSGLGNQAAHRQFSADLANFAQVTVPEIVAKINAEVVKNAVGAVIQERVKLVYAGGDDVLVLAPAKNVLRLADAIRTAFVKATGGLTASAGIAITPHKLPLDTAMQEARDAEEAAKDHYGRNAVVVRVTHRSGQIKEAGAQWEVGGVSTVELVADFQAAFERDPLEEGTISAHFTSDIQQLIESLPSNAALNDARTAEASRLLKRRMRPNPTDAENEFANSLIQRISLLGENSPIGWKAVVNWLLLAHFLAKGVAEVTLEGVRS